MSIGIYRFIILTLRQYQRKHKTIEELDHLKWALVRKKDRAGSFVFARLADVTRERDIQSLDFAEILDGN